jgi:hypothetical protein
MITHKRGATFAWTFTITDPEGGGLPFDLTGWHVACEAVGRRYGPANYAARIIFDATVINAAGGLVELTAAPVDTAAWIVGEYTADLRISQGSVVWFTDDFALSVVTEQTEAENA